MVSLNYRDSRPIYEQVKDGLRKLIVSGAIADGERLPSVRQLASQLAINPNTIQRAYNELEAEGYAVSIPGKGNFAVCGDRQLEEQKTQLRALVREMRARGVARAEIDELVKEGWGA